MPVRKHAVRTVRKSGQRGVSSTKPVKADKTTRKDTSELRADMDAILDEIDLVLETNAQGFVEGFIQRGGE